MLLLALLMIGALNFVANGQTNPDYKYDNPRVLDKSVIKVPVMKEGFAPAGQAEIRLDKKFYNAGDFISATVSKNSKMPVYHPFVVFVSPKTGDAEGLKLQEISDRKLATSGQLRIQSGGEVNKNDGILNVQPGEVITAYYYIKPMDKKDANNPNYADVAADFAFVRGKEQFASKLLVNKAYALHPNEAADNAATVLVEGQIPLQIARNQVIFYSNSGAQWKEFLEFSKAKHLATWSLGSNTGEGNAYLVEVPLNELKLSDLGQLREFMGLKERVFSSDENALKLALFCAVANLSGFQVSLNPRMMAMGESGAAAAALWANPPGLGESVPGSFTDRFTNVVKAWNFMSIWDRDNARIRVGIIDYGFHTNSDYRDASTMTECEASIGGVRCGRGTAQGPPTVTSFFGDRGMWHGNAVQARSCGVLNNNFGSAGTGGQVGVPMIIKMTGVETYAFNVGGAIRTAVDNGAHVINISGGFPCRALTGLGDFSYCDPGTRGAICAALFPIVQAGSVIACSALGWIPFAGPALVAGCLAVTSTTYISACVGQFALGNPGQAMSQAVQYAKTRGVPVVASAGNMLSASSIPEPLRPFVNLDPRRMTVEEWEIVPAGLPDVVCVGASNPDSPYANAQVFGARVDVWAPQDGHFMAPGDRTRIGGPGNPDVLELSFGGTSSAAPFITGLIANAMAVNPQLNRTSSSRITSIVDDIRTLLRTTAWPASALPADPNGRRRNLINPIELLKAAAASNGSTLPIIPAAVYGDLWNLDTDENTNDTAPSVLEYRSSGVTRSGAIIHIPGTGGAAALTDVDRFRINIPASYRPAAGEIITLQLRTPRGSSFGNLIARGTGFTLVGTTPFGANEEIKRYNGPAVRPGSTFDFNIEGVSATQDNIYQVAVGNVVMPPPAPTAISVTLNDIVDELCPETLERGDAELGGGPLMNISIELEVAPDRSGLDAVIQFRAEETGADRSTISGNFRRRVYTAPAGNRILSIDALFRRSSVDGFRGRSAGFEVDIFGCNEGVVEELPVSGNLVRRLVAVGDSGSKDFTPGAGCRCDSKIKSIQFNQVRIVMEPQS